jgi:hypothetical protein
MESTYFTLASKSTFNKALRHFYKVTDVVGDMESNRNIADVINEEIDADEINNDQVLPIVGAVIRDKFNYSYDSLNVPMTSSDFKKISDETGKWTALDIVLVYFNPNGKLFLINPKNIDHWERARELVEDQLLVIYVKDKKSNEKKIELEAIEAIEEMLAGKDVYINKEFIDQNIMPQKPAVKKAAPVSTGKKSITPKYAIQVSNELFHNGNVEAWKKIIESFKTSYPDLDVYIFHANEIVNDINSLFKWGKVKHGDSIFIQVGGENIRGVSKLQKYLFEGASSRFEQFLKIAPGQVLKLF